jgi:hypothetical protein
VLTNNEGNHGGSISSGRFQALDELFHLPNLNVLLSLVCLGVTHDEGRDTVETLGVVSGLVVLSAFLQLTLCSKSTVGDGSPAPSHCDVWEAKWLPEPDRASGHRLAVLVRYCTKILVDRTGYVKVRWRKGI